MLGSFCGLLFPQAFHQATTTAPRLVPMEAPTILPQLSEIICTAPLRILSVFGKTVTLIKVALVPSSIGGIAWPFALYGTRCEWRIRCSGPGFNAVTLQCHSA